jgi:hypothetical protein
MEARPIKCAFNSPLARPEKVFFDRDQPAVRFLRKYIKLALEPDSTNDDPALTEHVGNTLIVLTALCLGAARDAVETARAHGVRAARLQAIKAEIKAGFGQPNFSER